MANVTRTKLSLPDCFDGKRLAANMDKGVDYTIAGSIVGRATDFRTRKAVDGSDQVFTALYGIFEAIPVEGGDTYTSSMLYLPDGFFEMIAEPLRRKDASGNLTVKEVMFGAEVRVVRAKNPAGYSWAVEFAKDPTAIDPLADMKRQLAAQVKKTPVLAAPQPPTPPAKK